MPHEKYMLQLLLGAVICAALAGCTSEKTAAKNETARPAMTVQVERGPISSTLTISSLFKPFQEVDVHAKVSGYIRTIHVDVGDHVKEGQVLADLEVPELNAQMQAAEATIRRTKDAIRRAKSEIEKTQ